MLREGCTLAVTVVGSINLDITARVAGMPMVGQTALADEGWITPGGKGANQALAARLGGAATRLVGMAGDDPFRRPALALLEKGGVDLDLVRTGDSGTGLALIWLDAAGHNTITVLPRANRELLPDFFDPGPPLEAGDVVLISLEIPLDTAVAALEWARRGGAQVVLDPAPAPETLPARLWTADVLVPNQGEAARILGMPVADAKQARMAARALRQRGAGIGVVKMGAEGVAWATRQGVFYLPAQAVEAVDTTGAGDVFAGVLAASLALGDAFPAAMRRATQAAAISVTRPGAQPSFPTRHEVDQAFLV
jgi:ribokinase